MKHLVQPVLQARHLRNHGKMVAPQAAAAVVAVVAHKQARKFLEQFIALFEAVFPVIEFHTAEIHIQQCGLPAALQHGVFFRLGQPEEAGHGRKAGQHILLDALPQPLLQIAAVFLFLIFKHEAVQQATAENAADGVHREQRIEGLQKVKDGHRHAENADGAVAEPFRPLAFQRDAKGVGRRHQKHRDLGSQRDIARYQGVIDIVLIKAEKDRREEV